MLLRDDMPDIDHRLLVREGREADLAAAIDHLDGVVERARRRRTFEHVVDALAAVELLDGRNDVRLLRMLTT